MRSDTTECGKGHGKNWMVWLGHLASRAAHGLELGTFRGESAEWMLEHIFVHPESTYECVDTFEGSAEHKVGGVDCFSLMDATKDRLAGFLKSRNCVMHRMTSENFLRHSTVRITKPAYDFIYVDAAHDARNVLCDAVLAWGFLKVGGIMIFDDYEWKEFPDPVDCPKLAIDAFLACYARHLMVLEPRGWQIAVQKTHA